MRPIYYLKSALIGGILFAATGANAQMVGTNVFLKGHSVEVGIGHLGYYGSDAAAPAGYHQHCPGAAVANALGFVADPGATGWSTGSPHYVGDYFLPGSPFEGWALQVDTSRCEASNMGPLSVFTRSGGMPACTGSNISYTASGSTVSGTWQGVADSVQITQVTSLDTNNLYFTVKVTLTNLAVAPKDNIYYFRSVDPDNDETWPGGSFVTTNKIEHQMPGDTLHASVVSAVGPTSPSAYMALGTGDTNSRAIIYSSWPLAITQELSAVYNGTATGIGTAYYAAGDSITADIAIGLIVKVPHLATVDSTTDSVHRTTALGALHPANSATFSYFYAFSPTAVAPAMAATRADTAATAVIDTALGIKNVNSTADIKVYPNPTKNIINITGLDATDHLTMYDMMGKTVNQNWVVSTQGVNTFSMNAVPTGAYILIVQDANGSIKARVPVRKQ